MNESRDILIIDDEEVILDAIKKIALFEGYSSDICLNVSEAESYLQQKKYSLIICDIMMPDKDGFEFLKIVQQKRISTPVVITTGFSTLENAVKSLYDGAVGFIPKPFTVEELVSIIRRGIEYGKIFSNKYDLNIDNTQDLLSYVPCPPKYYRLGCDSWMNIEKDGICSIGVCDLFIKSIGTLKEFELLNREQTIYQGGTSAKIIENSDHSHQLLSPLSGKIIEVNEHIITDKILLEKDPYFQGWIYKIIPDNLEYELNNLTPCSTDI